jgi:hypothetical protein
MQNFLHISLVALDLHQIIAVLIQQRFGERTRGVDRIARD